MICAKGKTAFGALMDPRLLCLGLACVDVAMAAVSWLIMLCTYPDFARWQAAEGKGHAFVLASGLFVQRAKPTSVPSWTLVY